MDNMKHRRLQELDSSDFEIIKGDPDIRGWDIKSFDGQKVGEVEELIIDAQQKKVRYMVADIKDKRFKEGPDKVLIPIGLATLHDKEDDVLLPDPVVSRLQQLPEYDSDDLAEDTERKICAVLGLTGKSEQHSNEHLSDDWYKQDYYNDDNLYKNRLHEALPARHSKDQSEYDRGLRLWELRSEGGIINEGAGRNEASSGSEPEGRRADNINRRRREYEDRKHKGESSGHENSHIDRRNVEQRIRDEGLQDG